MTTDLRELLILGLALLILLLLLRAMYVMHRRRKGQIRLSIDRTFAQGADFEDPTASELPNGGARVVSMRGDRPVEPEPPALDDAADNGASAEETAPAAFDTVAASPAGERGAETRRPQRRKQAKRWKQEILESNGRSGKSASTREKSGFDPESGAVSITAGERIGLDSSNRAGSVNGRTAERAAQGRPGPAREAAATSPRAAEIPSQPAAEQEPAEPLMRKAGAAAPGAPKPARLERSPQAQRPEPAAQSERMGSRAAAESKAVSADRIVAVNVIAGEGREFAGRELWDFLHAAGLRHDPMKIFSKTENNREDGRPIFRVANIVNPGTFDADAMDDFSTPGISMFMLLPAPVDNLLAFEQMLAVARRLAETLGGRLLDGDRQEMTAQAIEQARRRIREFDNNRASRPTSASSGA